MGNSYSTQLKSTFESTLTSQVIEYSLAHGVAGALVPNARWRTMPDLVDVGVYHSGRYYPIVRRYARIYLHKFRSESPC